MHQMRGGPVVLMPAFEPELVQLCRSSLAGFKTSRRVIFTDALPKNTSGKILKRELRNRYRTK